MRSIWMILLVWLCCPVIAAQADTRVALVIGNAKAHGWYEKAVAGDASAMNKLGDLYANGEGVARDYAEARRWYEKAAAAGEVSAMYKLGDLYANGEGVTQDYAEARRWYEKGAGAGYPEASLLLTELKKKRR